MVLFILGRAVLRRELPLVRRDLIQVGKVRVLLLRAGPFAHLAAVCAFLLTGSVGQGLAIMSLSASLL